MFTTLLLLLYPPLKGFSHSLDHVRIRDKPLPAALQGDLKQNAFDRCDHCGIEPQLIKLELFICFVNLLSIIGDCL